MKVSKTLIQKFSLLTLTFVCFAFNGIAQWKVATPKGSAINDITFTDRFTGYAAITSTTFGSCSNTFNLNIYKTINAGESWYLLNTGTTATFTALHFINSFTGWIVGSSSSIYKTIDGGANWTLQSSGVGSGLNDIWFTSANNGFVIGNNGLLRKTTNGGASWQTIASGATTTLKRIQFFDAQNGFIACQDGKILKTSNGGTSWNAISTGATVLNDVHFTSVSTGYVIGYASGNFSVLKTNNGGNSWNSIPLSTTSVLNRIDFTNPNVGYIAASDNIFYKTVDAGLSWVPFKTPGYYDQWQGLSFIDDNIGFLCGNQGSIMKTTDAGATWNSSVQGFGGAGESVVALSKYTALSGGINGVILKTTNGGFNWKQKNKIFNSAIRKIYFVNDSVGFALSDSNRIYKTNDIGENWTLAQNNGLRQCYDMGFINQDTGYFSSSSGKIYKTYNQGISWDSLYVGAVTDLKRLFFINHTIGFAISSTTIFRTADAGLTWTSITPLNTFNLSDIVFVNDSLGYCSASSGRMLMTINAGLSWTERQTANSSLSISEMWPVNDSAMYYAQFSSQAYSSDSCKSISSQSTACLANNMPANSISMVDSGSYGYCVGTSVLHIKENLEIETEVSANSYCAGESIFVAYIARGYYGNGNQITIQLSNAGGSFANPTVIGTYSPFAFVYQSGVVTATLPASIPSGAYRVRAVSSVPVVIGKDNGFDIFINSAATPTVSLQSNFLDSTCQNSKFIFQATDFAGGQNPSYQWFLNGSAISNNSAIYLTDSLKNNDSVYVILTSDLACVSNPIAVSNTIKAKIFTSGVSIVPVDSVCATAPVQLGVIGGIEFNWTPAIYLDSAFISNPIARVDSTTNFTVLVKEANGCYVSKEVLVEVKPSPPKNIILTNDTLLCGFTNFQLFAVPGFSYGWSPATGLSNPSFSNPFVTITSSQLYQLTATNTIGCSRTDSVKIEVHPANSNAILTNDTAICGIGSVAFMAQGANQYLWSPSTSLSNPNISNPIATIAQTISYTLLTNYSNGCTSLDTLTITSLPALPSSLIQLDSIFVCPGTLFYLEAINNSNYTYQWEPAQFLSGATTAYATGNITNSTLFFITVSDTNNCSAVDSIQVNVFNYQTQFPVITNINGILTCTPAHFYQWYLDTTAISGATQQNYVPLVNGNYFVAVYDSAVCAYYESLPFAYFETSVKNSSLSAFRLFPNPTKGNIEIQTGIKNELTRCSLFDNQGRLVLQYKEMMPESNGNYQLNFTALEPGFYFLKLETTQGHVLQKLTVIK